MRGEVDELAAAHLIDDGTLGCFIADKHRHCTLAADQIGERVSDMSRLCLRAGKLPRPAMKGRVAHNKTPATCWHAFSTCLKLDHSSHRRCDAQRMLLNEVLSVRIKQRGEWQRVQVAIGHKQQPLSVNEAERHDEQLVAVTEKRCFVETPWDAALAPLTVDEAALDGAPHDRRAALNQTGGL
eukprot:1619772-Prymnesium_polylepis.1